MTQKDWVGEYAQSHRNPVNRACHTIGIPLIVLSLLLAIAALVAQFVSAAPWIRTAWIVAAAMFLVGWIFQFVGHAFEHKRPEFMNDPRFLLVGVRWWMAKIRGKA